MDETESDQDLVHMANELLIRFGREPYVKDLNGCDHRYFIDVYEAMIGESFPGLTLSADNVEDMIRNVQLVIDSLASDVLGMDISHVNAQMIVNKDREHIRCLLEIFDGLLEFVLEELTQDVEMDLQESDISDQEEADNSNDSNKLDDNHEILSDVFQEEFGQSYRDNISIYSKNAVARKPVPPSSSVYHKNSIMTPSEIGNSVTWKSDNESHTVGWSDTQLVSALSPSGESTATDELINLAQSTGNSTDELIREAQSIQKDLETHRSTLVHTKVQQEDDIEKAAGSFPSNSYWSSILSTTSSAVKSLAGIKEVGQQPHKKLPFEKEKKKDTQLHKHTHQDFHHVRTDSPHLSDLGSTWSGSSSNLNALPEMLIDSLQTTTEQFDKTISTYSDSTSMKDVSDQSVESLPHKQSKKMTIRDRGGEKKLPRYDRGNEKKSARLDSDSGKKSTMQGRGNEKKSTMQNGSCKEVSFIKDGGDGKKSAMHDKGNENKSGMQNGGSKEISTLKDGGSEKKSNMQDRGSGKKFGMQDISGEKEANIDGITSTQENMHVVDPQPSAYIPSTINTEKNDIKSTVLLDEKPERKSIGSNVQTNLEIPEFVPDSRSKQLTDLSERLQKLREQMRPRIPISLNVTEDAIPRQSNIVSKEKKDKAKVSFALDSELDEHHYSMSDTEIDYLPPTIQTESQHRRGQSHDEVEVHRGRGRKCRETQGSPPHRSILRTKVRQTDSSTSADETIHAAEDITARFEKPYFKRDERLRKVQKGLKAEEKENKHSVQKLRDQYSKHHGKLINQGKIVRKQSNIQTKETKEKEKVIQKFNTSPPRVRRSPRLKKSPVNKYAAKLSAIYGNVSPEKTPNKMKGRKRSASASPVGRRKYKTPMVLEEHEILPVMEDEFPFIHLSPHTAKLMWQKQLRHISDLSKHTKPHKTSKIQRTIADAQRKQKALAEVMKKEIEHNRRLKELKERKEEDTVVRRNLQERRQRSARARRYYNEYAVRNKARMLKKRTKEEKIFKQLFEDGLEIQKQRIKEMRDYAREQKEKNAKKQQNEIESLENFYRDKFACLAESVAEEKYELEIRQKAQAQVLDKMRCGMRKRMEKDLKDIQEQLQNDDDACFFRQLDADVLKKEFQLATYKASRLK